MATADRDLLLGMMALQCNFVTREGLLNAFNAWIANKSRDLGELLRDQGDLTASQLALLNRLTEEMIQRRGSVEQCLQQLSSISSACDELVQLNDPDLQASLRLIARSNWSEADRGSQTIEPSAIGDPSQVGQRFRILRPHARGGLGVVSVAHDEELNREVALKEIKSTYADDGESRARFLLEAEITGGLEHPGIVPVYGLGRYADGRPFYAMRFVRGDSLKQAIQLFHEAAPRLSATERNLQLRRLLQRFIDVCEAMHYAHCRGVLHRDLKPGNIMLGKYGETLVVDWGLARAGSRAGSGERSTTSIAAEASLQPRSGSSATMMGQALGTPEFMSPEQAAGRLDLLGPATDIYSLGATLYAILTGRAPVVGSDAAAVLQNVQAGRIVPPREHNHRIARPLEAICLRALARDPQGRYPSARALADEVEQWLADEPVQAYRESLLVRCRRALRKRPMLSGSIVAALLVGLLAFGIGSALLGQKNQQLGQANHDLSQANRDLGIARDDAVEQTKEVERQKAIVTGERDRAETQEQLAKKHADQAVAEQKRVRQAMDFLVAAFREPDPARSGRDLKASELMLKAATEAQQRFVEDPLLQGELLLAIWQTLEGLGLYQEALPIAEQAAELLQTHLPNDTRTIDAVGATAQAYQAVGQYDKAVALFTETLKQRRERQGDTHPQTLASQYSLANAQLSAGQIEQALPLFIETSKVVQEELAADNPLALMTLEGLAKARYAAGQFDQALPLFEQAWEKSQQLHPDHPNSLFTMNNLANAYASMKRYDRAIPLYEESQKKMQLKLGPDHPQTLRSLSALADAYSSTGQLPKAIPLFEEALLRCRQRLTSDHPDTIDALGRLERTYYDAGQIDKAVPLYEESLQRKRARLGSEDPATIQSMSNLLLAYLANKQFAKAAVVWEELLPLKRKNLPAEEMWMAKLLSDYSGNFLAAGAWELAEANLRRSVAIRQRSAPEHWTTFSNLAALGEALVKRGKAVWTTDRPAAEKLFAEAEPLLISGVQGMLDRNAANTPAVKAKIVHAIQQLLDLNTVWERPTEADRWRQRLAELNK